MAALSRVAAALTLLAAAPAWAQTVERWNANVVEASRRFGVPKEWIRRVMDAESGGRIQLNGRPITSRTGAMGLMQLMPGTWAEMQRTHRLGSDPYDPRDNILAGTAYLRAMYDRFGYPGLFAAYNAGPARYVGYLANGRRLPAETIAYLATVAGPAGRPSRPDIPSPPPLFAILTAGQPRFGEPPAMGAAGALFVRLSGASPR